MSDEQPAIEEWASGPAAIITAAIDEANALLQDGDKLKIFWGRENVPGYEFGSDCPEEFPGQVGLIAYRDDDVSFIIWLREHASLHTRCHRIRFVMDLPRPKILSTDPSDLSIIFENCPCVGLVTEPAMTGPIPGAIGVTGVETELPADRLSGGGLLDTLFILHRGFTMVERTLKGQQNLADFTPDSEEEPDNA